MDSSVPPTTIWSGSIVFGLVVLPVRLLSATRENAVRLREIHARDGGQIRHRRVCELDGQEVNFEDVGRAFPLPDGRRVRLTPADLESLPLPTRRVIDVLGFLPAGDVDLLTYSKPYWVAPGGGPSERPYAVLVEALTSTGLAGVAKIAIRSRERLAMLRPQQGQLVCQTLLWADELYDVGDLAAPVPVTAREVELAEVLMRELTGIDLRELRDQYRSALETLVDAKLAGEEVEALPEPAPAVDLMAALEESVRAARAGRAKNGGPGAV